MLVSAKEMLNKAKAGHYAVGQFNINNLEWTKSILLAAEETRSPVILGVSEGAGKYMTGYKTVVGMVNGMLEELNISVPVALHLDHGSYEGCYKCIEAGFSSIMFDGSHYPIEENIEKTKELVKVAKGKAMTVEPEDGYIGGEEEKSEKEPLRLWGKIEDGVIVPATEPVITCQCLRVPVLNGHTAAVFVKFRKKPTKEQLIEALRNFKGLPQELELPSAPKQFIQYLEEDNRPQVSEDVNYEHGMGVSVGRLREDTVYDYKFVGLSHNTVRGAAGGAVLCAETLKAKGYITKK